MSLPRPALHGARLAHPAIHVSRKLVRRENRSVGPLPPPALEHKRDSLGADKVAQGAVRGRELGLGGVAANAGQHRHGIAERGPGDVREVPEGPHHRLHERNVGLVGDVGAVIRVEPSMLVQRSRRKRRSHIEAEASHSDVDEPGLCELHDPPLPVVVHSDTRKGGQGTVVDRDREPQVGDELRPCLGLLVRHRTVVDDRSHHDESSRILPNHPSTRSVDAVKPLTLEERHPKKIPRASGFRMPIQGTLRPEVGLALGSLPCHPWRRVVEHARPGSRSLDESCLNVDLH
mmetsp:Transcript_36589/g.92026  ORF Transcript_36589/g.92026 Transcript_36589/m.92026 type:complete len:289 (-) Transcript_36589:1293-2159(-)